LCHSAALAGARLGLSASRQSACPVDPYHLLARHLQALTSDHRRPAVGPGRPPATARACDRPGGSGRCTDPSHCELSCRRLGSTAGAGRDTVPDAAPAKPAALIAYKYSGRGEDESRAIAGNWSWFHAIGFRNSESAAKRKPQPGGVAFTRRNSFTPGPVAEPSSHHSSVADASSIAAALARGAMRDCPEGRW